MQKLLGFILLVAFVGAIGYFVYYSPTQPRGKQEAIWLSSLENGKKEAARLHRPLLVQAKAKG